MPNIDQWYMDTGSQRAPRLQPPDLSGSPNTGTAAAPLLSGSEMLLTPSQIWPVPWACQLVDMAPEREASRAGVAMAPRPTSRTNPVRASANIVHPDLTLPPALDPEVIKLDKWIPLLCEMHHH
jgi:hypothetical protein